MSEFKKIVEACQRIFKNGTVLRNEVILINMDKIFDLPIISNQFDIQRCTFLTCDDGSDVWKREIIDNGKAFYILN